MVRKLIEWAVNSALIVLLLAVGLAAFGVYAFNHVNVEAYPDPAPAIIEVIAQYPGFSAEEVERRVTIPLEVTLAGMPGLTYTRSKSLAGLCSPAQPVRLRHRLLRRAPGSHQPPAIRAEPAQQRHPATVAVHADRRADPLHLGQAEKHARRGNLLPDRSQIAAGLDAGARVSPYPAHRRRVQLRRHGQALRDPAGPGSAQALRHHACSSSRRPSATATPTSGPAICGRDRSP